MPEVEAPEALVSGCEVEFCGDQADWKSGRGTICLRVFADPRGEVSIPAGIPFEAAPGYLCGPAAHWVRQSIVVQRISRKITQAQIGIMMAIPTATPRKNDFLGFVDVSSSPGAVMWARGAIRPSATKEETKPF